MADMPPIVVVAPKFDKALSPQGCDPDNDRMGVLSDCEGVFVLNKFL
jgi:hypothetical protein